MVSIYIKRKMLMHPETHRILTDAGFKIIPLRSNCQSINEGILWNWGWYGGELYAPILLNNPNFIHETSVLGCFEKHKEFMPFTTTSLSELNVSPDDFVVCKNNGFKGKGKIICKRRNVVDKYSIYQEFLGENREEYRVLMVRDKRIVSYRKLIEDKYNTQCTKTFKLCGGLRSLEPSLPLAIQSLARKVMQQSNLDIVGLDLMLLPDGKNYLIELNSAPGIGEYTASRLMEFLQKKYGND